MIQGFSVAVLVLSVFLFGSDRANSLEANRVLEKIAALEARIAALEIKNNQYQREAEEARAQARIAKGAVTSTNAPPLPNRVAPAMASVSYSAGLTTSSWTGVYWGASAGGAATRSDVTSSDRYTSTSAGPPPTSFGADMSEVARSRGGGGAVLDVFAGWNEQLSGGFVIGTQIEASAANLNFSSTGTRTYAYFDTNGPTGQTAMNDFRPQVASRWMATALLRGGILLDNQTLMYGLGGWTLAQFEARNLTDNPFFQPVEMFLANGWTVGAGIERRLDTNWSVRAEYRFTNFGSTRTNDHFFFQSTGGNSQTYQRQTEYDQSMQSGRIGVAYSFNPLR